MLRMSLDLISPCRLHKRFPEPSASEYSGSAKLKSPANGIALKRKRTRMKLVCIDLESDALYYPLLTSEERFVVHYVCNHALIVACIRRKRNTFEVRNCLT
jgi:hypothetical protein